ncbi:thioredoxin domain-containing protein 11 [Lissotriton helveticus]
MQRLRPLHCTRVLSQMARRPDLLCGAIALSCALIVALRFTCSRAKDVVMPAKPPVNFFPSMSPVVDLYRGQLDYAENIRRDSEITLFFLYAPWCGQSIAAREELEQVASKLADQVLFVAVNCWWNQGKCRKQKNLFYFPVIYLYHRSFGPIEYKGPLAAPYIEKFIRRVMTPLLYIPSRARLLDFISHYEPGVLGFFQFNASPQPPGYLTFFLSALHSLKKDYIGTVRFGVITDKRIANEISLSDPGSVYLHRNLNKSLVFPHQVMDFTAPNVCSWALDNRETILKWLRPHGGKSLLLNNELQKGPALIFFLPFNPLLKHHSLLDDITEVVLKYNNCNNSEVADRILRHLRHTDPPTADPFVPDSVPQTRETQKYSCCNTVLFPHWHSISRTHNVCELCINQTSGVQPSTVNVPRCNFFEIEAALDSYLREQAFMQVITSTIECTNFLSFYSPFNHYTACCRTVNRDLINSTTSKQNGLQTLELPFSSHGKTNKKVSVPHIEAKRFVERNSSPYVSNITGLRCRTNKTLNLYLIDSTLFWNYAVRLGASLSAPVKEFAAIIDLKEEIHYILDKKEGLLKHTIETFIQNFSIQYSPLRRHLVGASPMADYEQRLISEVTTATFRRIVLQNTKDVLLLYYAPWCGFCTALNHIFIKVARLLPAEDFIVARINVAENDLPWEFMVDYLPTILLFPHRRKDKSLKFPEDLEITVPNLLRFVLDYTLGSKAWHSRKHSFNRNGGEHSDKPSLKNGGGHCEKPSLKNGEHSEKPSLKYEGRHIEKPSLKNGDGHSEKPSLKNGDGHSEKPSLKNVGRPGEKPSLKNGGRPGEKPSLKNGGRPGEKPSLETGGGHSENNSLKNGGGHSERHSLEKGGGHSENISHQNAGGHSEIHSLKNGGRNSGKPSLKNGGRNSGKPSLKNGGRNSGIPKLKNGTPLDISQILNHEKNIQRLRAELGALRQAQEHLAVQISDAQDYDLKLRTQKHTLEENQALYLHKKHLQALNEQHTKQLDKIEEKFEELKDTSEALLKLHAVLKLLVASMDEAEKNEQ